jgi:hypothetical protein
VLVPLLLLLCVLRLLLLLCLLPPVPLFKACRHA